MSSLNLACGTSNYSQALRQTTKRDQNCRANKRYDDGSYYPASRRNSLGSDELTTDNSGHSAEYDVQVTQSPKNCTTYNVSSPEPGGDARKVVMAEEYFLEQIGVLWVEETEKRRS
jgi:hypothetical protein